eukprot:TRINITY_DN1265_c0_g1_i1.p1 TRINITY_DN1265_c0_g1~~TRINITY_DN1265_c0_g1_i1.p1  ORF type:complete len:630 (-),score=112.07 TRINITY_DN1265_c0_g1_i1:9-1898(-)
MCGIHQAAAFLPKLFNQIQTVLITAPPENQRLKLFAVELLMIILTATDNISQNTFAQYLMTSDLFDVLLQEIDTLCCLPHIDSASSNESHELQLTSFYALFAITVLTNYQRYESVNTFSKRVSQIDSDALLSSVLKIQDLICEKSLRQISAMLSQKGVAGAKELAASIASSGANPNDSKGTGILSNLGTALSSWWGSSSSASNAVGSVPFTSPAGAADQSHLAGSLAGPLLLSIYEMVVENKQFQTLMWWDLDVKRTTAAVGSSAASTSSTGAQSVTSPSKDLRVGASLDLGFSGVAPPKRKTCRGPPLLAKVLKLTSLSLIDMKDVRAQAYAKLSLITLVILTESPDINGYMRDQRNAMIIQLPFVSVRKGNKLVPSANNGSAGGSAPLPVACAVIDLLALFMKKNIKRDFHVDLFSKALDVLHRLLCYDKKMRIRLPYKWAPVWRTLMRLIQTLSKKDLYQQRTAEMLGLASRAVRAWNMFITFGDSFLPELTDYDDLYYEIMRSEKEWRAFIETMKDIDKDGHVMKDLVNLQSILDHFSAKIDQWYASNAGNSPNPQQVIKIIQDNYSTLKLKLHTSLDRFEPYVENPKETVYFRQLLRTLIMEFKSTLTIHSIDLPGSKPGTPRK